MGKAFKIGFKLFTLGTLSVCLWFFIAASATQSPKLSIKNQPDSPLQVKSFEVVPTIMEQSSAVTLILTSTSSKPIRAFAVASSVDIGKIRAQLITTNSDEQMWQLNEIKPITIRQSTDELLRGIELSIDFVEFSDGSTWGEDSFDSASSLAGEREALRATAKSLGERLKSEGYSVLINDLSTSAPNGPAPRGKSTSWERGFQRGVLTVAERLRRAHKKGGQEQLKAEWERVVADSKRISAQ